MTKRDAGISTEDRVHRQAVGAYFIGLLNPDGKKSLKAISVELELPESKLTDISRQKTRKRLKKNKDSSAQELVETEPGVVDEVDIAFIAGKAYDKGRGKFPDQVIFEYGLGQLVELIQIQHGSGLTDKEEAAVDEAAKAEIRALLNNRHEAHAIFTTHGLDRIRGGFLPGKKNGRPRLWRQASPEERLAAFDGWLADIEALGCHVFEREAWIEWFRTASVLSNMKASAWHYYDHLEIDGWEVRSLPCPPDWMLGVDTEYFGAFDALDSDVLLDNLILVTEGDMPYSTYHARFEQPKQHFGPCGHGIGANCADAEGWEVELLGDDIGAWIADRSARMVQSTAEATTLIARASRRKSGGVN